MTLEMTPFWLAIVHKERVPMWRGGNVTITPRTPTILFYYTPHALSARTYLCLESQYNGCE